MPKTVNASRKSRIFVSNGKTKKEVMIDTDSIEVEGQTSGEWAYLGSYVLPKGKSSYVSVSDEGADGEIIADAVLYVHTKE